MDIGIVRTPLLGAKGKSAYELALQSGFIGSLDDWLISLKGDKGNRGLRGRQGLQGLKGDDGKSSYELAVDFGYTGSINSWYNQFRIESIAQEIILLTTSMTTVWDTKKVSLGSSLNNEIKLPLVPTGDYDFYVDWGDGQSNRVVTWNQSEVLHSYSRAGIYLVQIKGKIKGWRFNNSGDKLKIIEIKSWGNLTLDSSDSYFWGCDNLFITAQDIFSCLNSISLKNCFKNCSSLTDIPGINYLNTSSIRDMSSMFENSLFNSDISNFDFRNVTSLDNFMSDNNNFNPNNYSKLLLSLSQQDLKSNVNLDVPLANYLSTAISARQSIINNFSWVIQDNGLI